MLIPLFFMGVSILRNRFKYIITYISISYKSFYRIGDMLIGSIKPLHLT